MPDATAGHGVRVGGGRLLALMASRPQPGPHRLLGRLYPDPQPLEQLLLQAARAAGLQEALQARLAYLEGLPARAELRGLLQSVWGVLSSSAPQLLPGTALQQTLTQADVRLAQRQASGHCRLDSLKARCAGGLPGGGADHAPAAGQQECAGGRLPLGAPHPGC